MSDSSNDSGPNVRGISAKDSCYCVNLVYDMTYEYGLNHYQYIQIQLITNYIQIVLATSMIIDYIYLIIK